LPICQPGGGREHVGQALQRAVRGVDLVARAAGVLADRAHAIDRLLPAHHQRSHRRIVAGVNHAHTGRDLLQRRLRAIAALGSVRGRVLEDHLVGHAHDGCSAFTSSS
jgi:hypothetical protein